MTGEPTEQQRLIEWLSAKWTQPPRCPICGTQQWTAGEVVELRKFNNGDLVIGGPGGGVYPVAQLICNTCGYTHFFNAVVAGVIDNPRPSAEVGREDG